MELKERFLQKYVIADNGCWNWYAASRGNGYGCIKVGGKTIDAHRIAYNLFIGEIPKGLLVCHTCDNRGCINPDHLFLGTYKDNYDDAVKKGRIDPYANKLPQGHPNMSSYVRGCRCIFCKEIQKLRMRKYRTNKKLRDKVSGNCLVS